MSKENYEDLWTEIRGLKEQLAELMVARETLIKHHAELRVVHDSLVATAKKTMAMAEELSEALEGRGDPND